MAKKNGKRSAAGTGTIRKKTMKNKKTGATLHTAVASGSWCGAERQ